MWFAFIFVSVFMNADGLSHWTRWSQLGSCSVTCGAGTILQKRACIGETPNPVCPGAQQRTSRCQRLACPENRCNCGCSLTGNSGNIRSISPSEKSLDCTWNIKSKSGSKIKLTVNNFILKYGILRIVGPRKIYRIVSKRKGRNEQLPFTVWSLGNQLNLSLHYHKVIQAGDGVKLEASYETLDIATEEHEEPEKDTGVNVPTVVGISTCVFIIILVTCLIVYRKTFSQGKSKTNNETENDVDENCASSSSTSIKHGVDLFWDQRDATQKQTLPVDKHISQTSDSDHQRLLVNQNNMLTVRINPTAVPMYINAANLNGQIGYNTQYNQQSYVLLPKTTNLIKQPQMSCTPGEKTISGVFNA